MKTPTFSETVSAYNASTPAYDSALLQQLYASSDDARAIFEIFATRVNNARETTVDRIVTETGLGRDKIIHFCMALQNAGAGTFVLGRKGRPSRFAWSMSLIEVAGVAKGSFFDLTGAINQAFEAVEATAEKTEAKPEVVTIDGPVSETADTIETTVKAVNDSLKSKRGRPVGSKNKSALFRSRFTLRQGVTVEFSVPIDMTIVEGQRLSDYVKLLALI